MIVKPKKILIFPSGTEIAFEMHNALKYSKFVELYGANSISDHTEFLFKRCITNLPFEYEVNFLQKLNDVIDDWEIDYIYPARDSSCLFLTQNSDKLHAELVTSPLETVEICRSKAKTYDYFKGEPFIPRYYHTSESVRDYPVFIKPAVGQGSEGAQRIDNKADLENALRSGTEYTICEYLPGDEYTVDCFTDRHRVLRVCHARKRERIRTGIAVRSSLIPTDGEITRIAEVINRKLTFNGAWFFQVKKNINGEYRLMEISPRIPGTMGVSRNLGINFPLLTLFNMWGYDIDIIDNKLEITLDRAFVSRYKTNVSYKKVYMDFDDTLYLGEKVNIQMIVFLYQCSNKGIPVVLLTKHTKDIKSSLHRFKISEALFDEVIQIDPSENKLKYIDEADAIFIDDSFAERKNIKDKIGIPVFDLDMIESLIDWRM